MKPINADNQDKQTTAIQRLVGGRLESVNFVMDYLILGFGPHGALTVLVWPEIIHNEKTITFGREGYRDKLCSLIECVVKSATEELDEIINVDFENGIHMRIPLKLKTVGERAILTGPEHYLCVF